MVISVRPVFSPPVAAFQACDMIVVSEGKPRKLWDAAETRSSNVAAW